MIDSIEKGIYHRKRGDKGNVVNRLFMVVKHNPLPAVASVIALMVFLTAMWGPTLAPHNPVTTDVSLRLAPPSLHYIMGNDALGRCLLSRILCGARISILLGVTIVGFSCILGVLIGLISGYRGGLIDEILMRITDVFFAFPEIIAAMAVAGFMGPGTMNLLLALSFVNWMRYARLVRGITLSVKERDFVKAAKLSGVSDTAVIIRHILPASVSYIIVLGTIGLAKAILAVSALGFLGFGVQPPHPEWGTLLMEGKDYILSAPHLSVFPGIVIIMSVLSFNIFGDFLKDMLDQ
jgi:peptide/nickel transport system permease protein